MEQVQELVSNKQVLASANITGNPKQTDMHLKSSTISLQLPPEASEAVLVKNLYLSCDPYMRGTKRKDRTRLFYSFSPDSVSIHTQFYNFFFTYKYIIMLYLVLVCVYFF